MEATTQTNLPAGNGTARHLVKQDTDLHILSDWIAPGSRVLDLGCGRGQLLEHLLQERKAQVVGVDSDLQSSTRLPGAIQSLNICRSVSCLTRAIFSTC